MLIQKTDPETSPSFWRPGEFRVFISYVTRQKRFAKQFQKALSYHRITSFVANQDIRPSADWIEQVLLALRTADLLLALVHRGFRESAWTGQEAGFAFGLGIPVLAVKLGEEPQGFLGTVQALDGQGRSVAWLAREIALLCATDADHRALGRS